MDQTDLSFQMLLGHLEKVCMLYGMKHPFEYGTYENLWDTLLEKLPIKTMKKLDVMMGDNYQLSDCFGEMHRKLRDRLVQYQ